MAAGGISEAHLAATDIGTRKKFMFSATPSAPRKCDSVGGGSFRARGRALASTEESTGSHSHGAHHGGTLTKGLPRSTTQPAMLIARQPDAGRHANHRRCARHGFKPDCRMRHDIRTRQSRPMPSAAHRRPGPRARSTRRESGRFLIMSRCLPWVPARGSTPRRPRPGLPPPGSSSGRRRRPCARRPCRARANSGAFEVVSPGRA